MYYICFDSTKTVSFSSAGRSISKKGELHPKRTLDSAVLLVGYSGENPIAQEEREYVLKKGSFQLLFPDTLHYGTASPDEGQSHFWCHFYLPEGFFIKEADSVENFEDGILCVLPEYAEIGNCEKIYILFSQMIDEAQKMYESNSSNSIICDSYIKIILLSLADQCADANSKSSGKRASVSKIKEWLRLHACDGITPAGAAKELQYNSDYLNQLIRADTGMTLCTYINHIRLEEAKRLLINSNKTVSEIAYEVGFSDEKYFMKVFRKRENVTPSQYRNAHFRLHLN